MKQCKRSGIAFPRQFKRSCNLRTSFSKFYGKKFNLGGMLEYFGMRFEGREHSGIDDSRNIARIVLRVLEDGNELRVNQWIR